MTASPLAPDEVRRARVRAQGLEQRTAVTSVLDAVRGAGGLQAQDRGAGTQSVRPRSRGVTENDVHVARVEDRSIAWCWAMRGTLHFVPTEDYWWLLDAFGPHLERWDARRRAELGWDDATAATGVEAVTRALGERGPHTPTEARDVLASHGLPWEGQATVHLLFLAAARGLVVRGPDRGAAPTYVLASDWLPARAPPLERGEALGRLAGRYIDAFGPATVRDFAAWSGLSVPDAREGWARAAASYVAVTIEGEAALIAPPAAGDLDRRREATGLRLLPAFDTYLLGYRDRSFALPSAHAGRYQRGGILAPTVILDGLVVGTWRATKRRGAVAVGVEWFEESSAARAREAGLVDEVSDLGRFLGRPAALEG